MTDFTRHCLSYFKEHKVHYYFMETTIVFACPNCPLDAVMDSRLATWECPHCHSNGTLISLSTGPPRFNRRVYNPVEERRVILRRLRRWRDKVKVDAEYLDDTIERLTTLLDYWQSTRQR